ncbi:restriction endonuclease subunit S [Mesomycoplasma hyorhinis]|uniref:restriction endonuclease subunit S n=3 Tax=Mesomycoplasma hyorhinis TaxID=2100 RepID=UPI001C058B23|nr:restriction endonuclease subunit S [Mesomycoplasma hyorhinis]
MFFIDTGNSKLTKQYIKQNLGKYPVYSSQTENNGIIGYINTYDFDGEFITWTQDGNAGKVFYRNGRFNASNSGILTLNFPSKYNLKFLFLALIFLDLTKLQIGGTVPHFTASMMRKVIFLIPKNKVEQEKISSIFFTLDKIVSLYERKISLLEKLEKALFSKLFVNKKNETPSIRFKGFSGFWETKNISELCKINRGNSKYTANYIKQNIGKYPVYSSQTQNEGISGNISTYEYDGEFITWTMDGVNAGTVFYRNAKFNVSSSGVLSVKSDMQINTKFLFYVLRLMSLNKENMGETIPHFTISMMEKLEITILNNVQEQTKIAEVFSSLNLTYAQLKRKLNLIKNIQKSVLNKMFV